MRECDPAGAPGVEKTHLAAAPGVKAADVGHRVLFMPQDRLVDADESEAGKPPEAPATTTELCAGADPGRSRLPANDQ
ncbi:ATP-binding protein [Salmonella enterica]|nr:ATP-binding protein [Salmonella enterica]